MGTFLRFPVAESKTLFFYWHEMAFIFYMEVPNTYIDRVSYFPYYAKQSPFMLNTASMATIVSSISQGIVVF